MFKYKVSINSISSRVDTVEDEVSAIGKSYKGIYPEHRGEMKNYAHEGWIEELHTTSIKTFKTRK